MKKTRRPSKNWNLLPLYKWIPVVFLIILILAIPYTVNAAVFNIPSGDVAALTAAINQANTNQQANTINLMSGTYVLNSAAWENLGSSCGGAGLPPITGNISIEGNRAIIQRGGSSRSPCFRIFLVDSEGELILRNVTVQNGLVSSDGGAGIFNRGNLTLISSTVSGNTSFEGGVFPTGGGGILNEGTVTLFNSIVTGNTAQSASGTAHVEGGGIYNNSGTVILHDSIVEKNTVYGRGGGIRSSFGTVTIENSTIRDNHSYFASGIGGFGGGIFNGGATMTLVNTTIQDNMAHNNGGGIFNNSTVNIVNSTFKGNSAGFSGPTGFDGGGIYTEGGKVTLTNSTISGNIVDGRGGGIRNSGGQVELVNTIVAQNISEGGFKIPPNNCDGPIVSRGHNLENENTCSFTASGDHPRTDPKMGAFANFATLGWGYFPLLPGSPAIDAGDASSCPSTDQLGSQRERVCDIGAIEYHSPQWLDVGWTVILAPPYESGGAQTARAFGIAADDGEKTNLTDDAALLRAFAGVEDEFGHISDAKQTILATRRFRLADFHSWRVYLSGALRGILESDSSLQGSEPFAVVNASAQITSNGIEVLKINFDREVSNGADSDLTGSGAKTLAAEKVLSPGDYVINVTLSTEAFVPGRLSPLFHNIAKADFFSPGRGWDVGFSVVDQYLSNVNDLVTLNSAVGQLNRAGATQWYRIDARFTNDRGNICYGGFQVIELQTISGTPLQIHNANGAGPFGGIGTFVPFGLVTHPPSNMQHFARGQSAEFEFIIPVPQIEAIRLFVNVVGERSSEDCSP
jgi:hypothetical protein